MENKFYYMENIIIEPIEKYGLSGKDRPKTLFSKIGVVGCGSIGQRIVIIAAKHGIEVIFLELSHELIQESLIEISFELDKEINHWGLTPSDKRAILSRIKGTLTYKDFHDCDLVIDAIKAQRREYSIDIRKEIFKNIEKHVSKDCIIATNSSTILITEISSELKHKERCLILHISTTMPGASVVEVARGLYTSDAAYDKVLKFVKRLDKIAIPVIESPGLISIRLFVVLLNEACEVLMEGVSSIENIDLAMRTCFHMPLGPFEMADIVGLDKMYRWMENLYNEFGDIRYKSSPLIKKYVRSNCLGKHTGKGFYVYDNDGEKIANKHSM